MEATLVLSNKELRKFGVTMFVAFGVFLGGLLPLLFRKPFPVWPWVVGGAFGVVGLLYPRGLNGVHTLWMKFAHVLGYVNTRILLGVIYVVIVIPVGFLKRRFGTDSMARELDKNAKTYRIPRAEKADPKSMESPF